jgi:3'(2'), 5'-bisphosphate nucleotidase
VLHPNDDTHTVTVSHATLARLVALADRAGEAILALATTNFDVKADGSPVTRADRVADDLISTALAAWDATIPIVSEESRIADAASRRDWQRYWLVDPLDGTKEFLAGSPEFTVNIALIDNGTPVLGVVGAPALHVTYYAGQGLGSWRREGTGPAQRIVAAPAAPGSALRVVESRSHPSPQLERFLSGFERTARTRMGSSLKFCRVAEGLADCYPRLGPTMAWDVAAGDCVFRNASADGAPHPSPLTYDPADFRQPPFVIGFAPPEAVARVLSDRDHDRARPAPPAPSDI